jgi:hypothetical protein
MNAGTMYFKIVTRKLQGSQGAYQFMLLAGATNKLAHTTADFYETLSPNHVLRQEEIAQVVAKLQKLGSYGSAKDITNPDIVKKLHKLFDIVVTPEGEAVGMLPSFAALGIGNYL